MPLVWKKSMSPWCLPKYKAHLKLAMLVVFAMVLGGMNAQGVYVHFDRQWVEIRDLDHYRHTLHRKWTINSPAYAEHAVIAIGYDSFCDIDRLKVRVYDQQGREIHTYYQEDFRDVSSARGFEVLDNRQLYLKALAGTYPFTIELFYVKDCDQSLFFPKFKPAAPGISLSSASFSVSYPNDYTLRYKSQVFPKPEHSTDPKSQSLLWTLENFEAAPETEPLTTGERSDIPYVILAPTRFEMEGVSGDLNSWAGLGEWSHKLQKGRQELPEEARRLLHERTDSLTSSVEKVQSVYRWVQDRTRYVSVQLGIGGWQPMTAEMVHETGYGDCKALVNYTLSALQEVGITSHPALIYANPGHDIDTDFPYQAFNHVILCVPLNEDTLWLECTDQNIPPGYLGISTSGKKALLLKANEYKLIGTPDPFESRSIISTSTNLELLTGKSARVSSHCSFSGEISEAFCRYIIYQPERVQKDFCASKIFVPQTKIAQLEMNTSNQHLTAMVDAEYEALTCYSTVMNSVILSPGFIDSFLPTLPPNEHRKSDIVISQTFQQTDTVKIMLPQTYRLEHIPASADSTNNFGAYSFTYSCDENFLYCTATRSINKGKYPAEEYEDFRKFLADMDRLWERRILLEKIESPH